MSKPKPNIPKLGQKLLSWILPENKKDVLLGDFAEYHARVADKRGRFAAFLWYWGQLFASLPSFIHNSSYFGGIMLKNYFVVAVRNLKKNKGYSFINISGLAIGLASFIIIFLFVEHELSYDNFYEDSDQIYRVYQRQIGNEYIGTDYFAVTPASLASIMEREYPEVTHATTLEYQNALIGVDESSFEDGLWAAPNFFDVFSHTFLQGDPENALTNPESVVLTESLARKLFKDENPIGKTITRRNRFEHTVTAVIKDLPVNSSLQFSFITSLLSHNTYKEHMAMDKWNGNSFHTFFKLLKGSDPDQLAQKFPALVNKYGDYEDYPFKDVYQAQPLSELHLASHINFDIGLKGNPRYVYWFSFIALLILALASINYMNLAIARSINRAKEVGLRKAIGARREQLVFQYLSESLLVSFLALLLAVALAYFILPTFANLVERSIALNLSGSAYLLPGLLGLVLIVGLISGSYPAFFMSAFRPTQVLKGGSHTGSSKMSLQKMLIVGQYGISIVLIISSLVIYEQFQFIQKKELGYSKDQVLTIEIRDNEVRRNFRNLKNEWLTKPEISDVTASRHLPVSFSSSTIINDRDGSDESDDLAIYVTDIDYNFLDFYGIELVAGRNISLDFPTDAQEGYILNETAVRALGWEPEEAVGQEFTHEGTEKIIGVVKDFHMHSLHETIQPLMMRPISEFFWYMSLKVQSERLPETIAYLEKSVQAYSSMPFQYQFLDERFDQLYKSEQRLGEMFAFFTLLSILIASMGLFGLAAFTATQRTKEIGIRKVLGASVQSIVAILSRSFLMMVLWGFVIATPIAWYAMSTWLNDFAYRIDLEWWIFAIPGFFALLIAGLTVSSQSLKAALINPVDSLKSE